VPTLRFVESYFDHPDYIAAMRDHISECLTKRPQPPDKFVITFHGIPRRYVETGDPYRAQCERTAHLLAEAMGWRDDDWLLCFQSRFGPEAWLEPYTDRTLEELSAVGVKRPFVFSPGFVTDCLETLDELGNEGKNQFVEGGGNAEHYFLAPCLNVYTGWIDTLTRLIEVNTFGWVRPHTAYGLLDPTPL
jgi:ferrochelatase